MNTRRSRENYKRPTELEAQEVKDERQWKTDCVSGTFLLTVSNGPPHHYHHRPSTLRTWLPLKKRQQQTHTHTQMASESGTEPSSLLRNWWVWQIAYEYLCAWVFNINETNERRKKKKLCVLMREKSRTMSTEVWWLQFSINYTCFKTCTRELIQFAARRCYGLVLIYHSKKSCANDITAIC